jgi:hypothetical protein
MSRSDELDQEQGGQELLTLLSAMHTVWPVKTGGSGMAIRRESAVDCAGLYPAEVMGA